MDKSSRVVVSIYGDLVWQPGVNLLPPSFDETCREVRLMNWKSGERSLYTSWIIGTLIPPNSTYLRLTAP